MRGGSVAQASAVGQDATLERLRPDPQPEEATVRAPARRATRGHMQSGSAVMASP
ncbi:hypothetical protein GCM10010371_63860 [Streptomyces subrutilus]|uniref:Uncharacterized protein n=1 Tax=Streptomyces subrutilus TaxID=36818 RepID=A0A918VGR9_9ACTN|nr:hypothetical protein GCM10010371_63860 [Streptomyces subrutilus]